jgi:hypothetical protein
LLVVSSLIAQRRDLLGVIDQELRRQFDEHGA